MHNGFVYQLSWQERKRRQRKWLFAGGGLSLCLAAVAVAYWPQSSDIPQASVIKEIEPKVVKSVHKPKALPRSRAEERLQQVKLQDGANVDENLNSATKKPETEKPQSKEVITKLVDDKQSNQQEIPPIQVEESIDDKTNLAEQVNSSSENQDQSTSEVAEKVNPVPPVQVIKNTEKALSEQKEESPLENTNTQTDKVNTKDENSVQTAQPVKEADGTLTKEEQLTALINKVNPVPPQQKVETADAQKRVKIARKNIGNSEEPLDDVLENRDTQSKITLPEKRPSFRSDFKTNVKLKPSKKKKAKRRQKKRKKRYYGHYDRYDDYRVSRYDRDYYDYEYRRKRRAKRYNYDYDYYSDDYYRNYRKYRRRFRQRYGY